MNNCLTAWPLKGRRLHDSVISTFEATPIKSPNDGDGLELCPHYRPGRRVVPQQEGFLGHHIPGKRHYDQDEPGFVERHIRTWARMITSNLTCDTVAVLSGSCTSICANTRDALETKALHLDDHTAIAANDPAATIEARSPPNVEAYRIGAKVPLAVT